jgi:hypothetical protein
LEEEKKEDGGEAASSDLSPLAQAVRVSGESADQRCALTAAAFNPKK